MPATIATGGMIRASAAQAIAFPAAERALAVNAIADYLKMLRAWTETRYAVAGDGASNVEVLDRHSYIYARLGSADGELIEAKIINVLDPQDGDALLVRRERPGGAGGWLVLDVLAEDITTRLCNTVTCLLTQSATLLLRTLGAGEIAFGASVVVRGNYAYVVMSPVVTAPPVTVVGNSELWVIDISDYTSPSIVDTQDLGHAFDGPNIEWRGDVLWLGGVIYQADTLPVDPEDWERRIMRFDISTPDAPSLTDDEETPLTYNWVLYTDLDGDYLIGTGYLIAEGFYVVDGTTLAEIGHVVPTYGAAIDWMPVIVGTHAAIQSAIIDLSDPTTPTEVYADNSFLPDVPIDATTFYGRDGGTLYLYDITTPSSPTTQAVTVDAGIFGQTGNEVTKVGACWYLKTAPPVVYNVFDPTDILLADTVTPTHYLSSPKYAFASGSVDGSNVLRYCEVGYDLGSGDVYLQVYTNQP